MRNNTLVAVAVAGVLASAAASAKTIDVYASGASAQRTFWFKEMGATYCGSSSAAVVYAYADPALTINVPDFQAATCTATTAANGVVVGDTVNLHYAADLGSVWAIAGALNTTLTRSQMVIPATNTGCTSKTATSFPLTQWNCAPSGATGTQYTRSTDSGGQPFLTQHVSDLLLSDLEPAQFVQADNWPTASAGTVNNGPSAAFQQTADTTVPSKLGTQPSASKLATTGMTVLNGEVFSFISNGIPGNPSGLSSQSLATIFQGGYATWNEVPEVGAADTASTPITICRRDHGSGSEIAASIFLTRAECNAAGAVPIASNSTFNNLSVSFLVESASSTDLKACITGITGSIGILSVGTSSAYTTLNVDGIQPNAHNAALGAYKFATETFGKNITATTEGGSSTAVPVAAALFAASQSATRLGADGFNEAGTTANGAYTVNSGTAQQVAYSLPPANAPSAAAYAAAAPTALYTRKGASCTETAANTNTN